MRRAAGFTLLELLVVLAIIALITAIAIPDIRMPRFASDASRAARQIASGLADARQRAIHGGHESAFVVNLMQHSFHVGETKPVPLAGIAGLSLLTAEHNVISRTSGRIRFYPDGSSDGGEVAVKGSDGVTVTVRVNWLTGRITHDG